MHDVAVVAVAQLYGIYVHIVVVVVAHITIYRELHILLFNLLLQGAIKDSFCPQYTL